MGKKTTESAMLPPKEPGTESINTEEKEMNIKESKTLPNLDQLFKEEFRRKSEDGTIRGMVSDAVDRMVKSVLENATFSYSEPMKAMKAKLEDTMRKEIENYDFGTYVDKLDLIITEALKGSAVETNRKLLENFNTILGVPAPKEISLKELFDKYVEFIKEDKRLYDIDDNEWDYEEGEYSLYENISMGIHIKRDHRSNTYQFHTGEIEFSTDHNIDPDVKDEDTRKIKIGSFAHRDRDDEQKSFTISGITEDLASIARLSKFSAYLLSLQQAETIIRIDSDIDCFEEEILIEKEEE